MQTGISHEMHMMIWWWWKDVNGMISFQHLNPSMVMLNKHYPSMDTYDVIPETMVRRVTPAVFQMYVMTVLRPLRRTVEDAETMAIGIVARKNKAKIFGQD